MPKINCIVDGCGEWISYSDYDHNPTLICPKCMRNWKAGEPLLTRVGKVYHLTDTAKEDNYFKDDKMFEGTKTKKDKSSKSTKNKMIYNGLRSSESDSS